MLLHAPKYYSELQTGVTAVLQTCFGFLNHTGHKSRTPDTARMVGGRYKQPCNCEPSIQYLVIPVMESCDAAKLVLE